MKDANIGCTRKVKTPCGNLYVTVNYEDGKPSMAGFKMGKAGGCVSAQMEMVSRLITRLFELGEPVNSISTTLRGIGCHLSNEQISSCPNAISESLNIIEEKMRDGKNSFNSR